MTKIKFCGLTRREDVQAAVAAGADFVGFNFFPQSSRFVSIAKARELARELPPNVKAVGVFVNADPKEIALAVKEVPLSMVQFHGDEDQADTGFDGDDSVIKCIRLGDTEDVIRLTTAAEAARYLLLDKLAQQGIYGGTGETIDENLIEQALRVVERERVFLAGGLTPGNVEAKVRRFRPFAVDVASGIEVHPGLKSTDKMHAFVKAVRRAEADTEP